MALINIAHTAPIGARGAALFIDHVASALLCSALISMFATENQGLFAHDISASFHITYLPYSTLVFWFYSSSFETVFSGRTPGKWLLKLRATNKHGLSMTIKQALARSFIKVFSHVLLIGYIMAALRSDKRTLHDLVVGTTVIQIKNP